MLAASSKSMIIKTEWSETNNKVSDIMTLSERLKSDKVWLSWAAW